MTDTHNETLSVTERLAAIEAIRALKARYFRLMDTKDWAQWEHVFAPDATMDMTGESASLRSLGFELPPNIELTWHGAAEIRSAVSTALANITSVHHGHMPELEILSPRTATGIWAMEDLILYGQGAPVAGFRGYGHYFDAYTKIEGRWHIHSTRLTRLCIRPIPLGKQAPGQAE